MKSKKTIEEILEQGKNISLSEAENNDLKSSLISYAKYHKKTESNNLSMEKPKTRYYTGLRTLFVSFTAVFVFIVTGFASENSLPGDLLYTVKVDVYEEMVGLSKYTAQERLTYKRELFERRLSELKKVTDTTEIEELPFIKVGDELRELSEEVDVILNRKDELNVVATLDTTSQIVSISEAILNVSILNDVKESDRNILEDVNDRVSDTHIKSINNFTDTDIDLVKEFVQIQLDEIEVGVSNNSVTEDNILKVVEYIEGAQEALLDENISKAAMFVSEAEQTLDVEEYDNIE